MASAQAVSITHLYPEGLRGLIELVRRAVPAARRKSGPYDAFLLLLEQNLVDWETQRQSRGHLVGMGMGSIYDIAGPSPRAPREEREKFDRFTNGLEWLHRITWICAEAWPGPGTRWRRKDDRALLEKLELPRDVIVWAITCRKCDWRATTRRDICTGAQALEDLGHLRMLVDRDGRTVARALLRPPSRRRAAMQEALRTELSELVASNGTRIYASRTPRQCRACSVPIIGTYLDLDAAELRRIASSVVKWPVAR